MTWLFGSKHFSDKLNIDIDEIRKWAGNKRIIRSNFVTEEWINVTGIRKFTNTKDIYTLAHLQKNRYNELEYREYPFITISTLIEKEYSIEAQYFTYERSIISTSDELLWRQNSMLWFRFNLPDITTQFYTHSTSKTVCPKLFQLFAGADVLTLEDVFEIALKEQIALKFTKKGNAHDVEIT